ncbi:MAG: ATP-dependent RNA helicase RhlE, partial [Gammaproteobacteria bacterium]
VHRIGRTGRAGANGEAISLVCPEESQQLAAIEKLLGRELPRVADTGYEPVSLNIMDRPHPKAPKNPSGKKDYRHHNKAPKHGGKAAVKKSRRGARI